MQCLDRAIIKDIPVSLRPSQFRVGNLSLCSPKKNWLSLLRLAKTCFCEIFACIIWWSEVSFVQPWAEGLNTSIDPVNSLAYTAPNRWVILPRVSNRPMRSKRSRLVQEGCVLWQLDRDTFNHIALSSECKPSVELALCSRCTRGAPIASLHLAGPSPPNIA